MWLYQLMTLVSLYQWMTVSVALSVDDVSKLVSLYQWMTVSVALSVDDVSKSLSVDDR